jgi:hypothetical protein
VLRIVIKRLTKLVNCDAEAVVAILNGVFGPDALPDFFARDYVA